MEATSYINALMPHPQDSQIRQPDQESGSKAQKDKKTILVAEDNEAIATATQMVLQLVDFTVLQANDGRQVIDMANSHHPDLILMDIQMPGMDGLRAIKTIRANPDICTTPIIAVTGRAMPKDKTLCLQAGADKYFCKPYPVGDLVKCINELCAAKHGQIVTPAI